MRRLRIEYTRWGIEPPFPWLGLGIGVVIGLTIMPLAAWLLLELVDCDLGYNL